MKSNMQNPIHLQARLSPLRRIKAKAAFALLACFAVAAQAASFTVTVTDKDGKPAANAVVSVYSTAQASAKPPAQRNAIIAQEKMQFIPYVSVLPVGTAAKFSNRDAWDHHIKTIAGSKIIELRIDAAKRKDAKDLSTALIPTESSEAVVFDQPGPVSLGCHLHGSMRGFVFVTDTPWTGKSDAQGIVTINDIPEGDAEFKTWHPDQFIDQANRKIKVTAVTTTSVQLNIAVRVRRAAL
jgi:plastocyanin